MSRITKIIGPDGRVTTIRSKSSCGCLTVVAAIVVIFGPAAWFGAWAVPAYVFLAVFVLAVLSYQISQARRRSAAPAPPPAPPTAHPGV